MASNALQFNYCDLRCDRCDDAMECPVNKRERIDRLMHIVMGEDPDDMAACDIGKALAESMGLIEQMVKRAGIGIDLGEKGEEEFKRAHASTRKHALYRQAYDFMKRCNTFLGECKARLTITPEIKPLFSEIEWNRTLIPAKAARALFSAEIGSEFGLQDARLTTELIVKCLNNCLRTLNKISFYRPDSADLVHPLKTFIEDMVGDWEKRHSHILTD